MASIQKRIVKGKEYWSIVESKRINGKPRPVVVEYIGNTKKLYEYLQKKHHQRKFVEILRARRYARIVSGGKKT